MFAFYTSANAYYSLAIFFLRVIDMTSSITFIDWSY